MMQERFMPDDSPGFRGVCVKCGSLVCKFFAPPGFTETEDTDFPDKMLCSYCAQRGLVEAACMCGQCSTPANLTSVFELHGTLRGYDLGRCS